MLTKIIFGWSYEEASVYICIYLWPALCVLVALVATIYSIRKKNAVCSIINGILLVAYSIFTWIIYTEFMSMDIEHQFNTCMFMLIDRSVKYGISYEMMNLLFYVGGFALIVLIHTILTICAKKTGKMKK